MGSLEHRLHGDGHKSGELELEHTLGMLSVTVAYLIALNNASWLDWSPGSGVGQL